MTRVLQIRRGNAAQNNNFTGMPGEITMDTDTKTIRIHDGETLGGVAMARADSVRNSEFDINTVPDDFWAEKIRQFAPDTLTMTETRPVPISGNTAYINYLVGGDARPVVCMTTLVCKSPDAGYNIGDEVNAFGIGTRTNPMPNFIFDADGLNLRLMVGGDAFWVMHKDTGEQMFVDDENWNVIFRIYC